MSSRYVPPHDSRYRPDRTPPRYSDRRSSASYGPGFGPRYGETNGRTPGYDAYDGSHYHPPEREAPRGPKALLDSSRGPRPAGLHNSFSTPTGPRGRISTFRDGPELRDQPPLSAGRERDAERNWRSYEFDRPGRRVSPRPRTPITEYRDFREHPPSRDLDAPRARTPVTEYRDFREHPPSRDVDAARARRQSRDALLPADPPMCGGFTRGGRGRGLDRTYISRAPEFYTVERDSFRPRSWSRERNWERDRDFVRDDRERERGRDTESKIDSRVERREQEKRIQREKRSREAQRYKRDQGPTRPDSRYPSAPSTAPSTPHAPSALTPAQASGDRNIGLRDYSSDRRTSNLVPGIDRSTRRDSHGDVFGSRLEASREKYGQRPSSPPPQAPQVPAFGTFPYNPAQPIQYTSATSNVWRASESRPVQQLPVTIVPSQILKTAPTAPKAQLADQPPTAPKADRIHELARTSDAKDAHSSTLRPVAASIRNPSADRSLSRTRTTSDGIPESISSLSQTQNAALQEKADDQSKPSTSFSAPPNTANNQFSGPTKPQIPPTGPQAAPKPAPPPAFQPNIRLSTPNLVTSHPLSPPIFAPSGPRLITPFSSTSPKTPIIPTGPRADRTVPIQPRASGPPYAGKNLQWIRPGLPAHANKVQPQQVRKDLGAEDRDRPVSAGTDAIKKGGSPTSPKEAASASPRLPSGVVAESTGLSKGQSSGFAETRSSLPPTALNSGPQKLELSVADDAHATPSSTHSSPSSSDGEEEVLAFDEADLAEHEAKFTKDKTRLESQKVDLGTEQLRVVPLLLELEQLAVLSRCEAQLEARLKEISTASQTLRADAASVELLTPKAEETDDINLENTYEFREPSVASGPDLDSLPYLQQGMLTPLSDVDIFQETLALHETWTVPLHDAFLQQWEALQDDVGQKRRLFAKLYSDWRKEVKKLDAELNGEESEKRQQSLEVEPTILPQELPSVLPSASIDGTRRHRWGTEHDLQLAIQASLEQEEQMQNIRRQEDNKQAKPDVTKEAVIPNIYDRFEKSARVFKDTNRLLDPDDAFYHFELAPPRDEFTSDEHRILVQNFREYPKKWGRIAQALPGRGYKQCINHYYATKWDKEYKAPRDRRRGRGPRARIANRISGQGRMRGGSLMANLGVKPDLYDGDEFAQPSVTATDTRRPKRAAAPVFGDKESDLEQATPAATPGKKNNGSSKTDNSGDATAEKPKRQRLLNKEKGPRRTRNQPLAAAPPAISQLAELERKEELRGLKSEVDPSRPELEDARLLTDLNTGMKYKATERQFSYREESTQATRPIPSPEIYRSQPQALPPQSRGGAAGGPTSYWSVAEQLDFPRLIAHFGTDWSAISNYMGSKTQTMVKNHYNRLLDNGRASIGEAANEADARRQRGDDVGPPPPLSFVPVKRPDNAQTVTPRSIAPSTAQETANVPIAPPSQAVVHGSPTEYIPPYRYSAIAQAAKPPGTPFGPSISQQTATLIPPPAQTQSRIPQPSHGPRLGIFSDNRFDSRRILQSVSSVDTPLSSSSQQQFPHDRHRMSDPQSVQAVELHERLGRPRSFFTQDDQKDAFQPSAEQPMLATTFVTAEPREIPVELQSVQAPLGLSRDNTDRVRQGLSGLRHLIDPNPQQPVIPNSTANPTSQFLATRPQPEGVANNPVPAPPPSQPTPRPPQEPPRRSNIMSILNAEPEDPKPAPRLNDRPSASLNGAVGAPETGSYQRQPPLTQQSSAERIMYTGTPVIQPHVPRLAESGPRSVSGLLSRDAINQSGSRSEWPLRMGFYPSFQPNPQSLQQPLGRDAETRSYLEQRPGALQAVEAQSRHVPSPPAQPSFGHSRGRSFAQVHDQNQQNTPTAAGSTQPQAELRSRTPQHQPQQVLHANPYAQVAPPPAVSSHMQPRHPIREDAMEPDTSRTQLESRIEQARRDSYFSQVHNHQQYSINHALDPLAFHPLAHSQQHHHHHRHHHHHHHQHPSRGNVEVLHSSHQPNGEPVIDVLTQRGQHDYHDPRRPHVEDISFPRQLHDQDRRQLIDGRIYSQRRVELEEQEQRTMLAMQREALQRDEEMRRLHQHQQQQQQQQQQPHSMYGSSRTPTATGMYQPPQGR